jgi:hypothetical protein
MLKTIKAILDRTAGHKAVSDDGMGTSRTGSGARAANMNSR